MLFTIAALLTILWLLGLVTGFTLAGFTNLFLIGAIILVLIRVIKGESY